MINIVTAKNRKPISCGHAKGVWHGHMRWVTEEKLPGFKKKSKIKNCDKRPVH